MGTKDKLVSRFKNLPSDFTFDELIRLLGILGYELKNKGKTSGSRVVFTHPGNTVKAYAMKQIFEELVNKGKI